MRRKKTFREKLADVNLLDNRGYITMPFSTSFDRLSPLTRNHKILRIEAEIIGEDLGDPLGRIYVSQSGTGVVRTVTDTQIFFAFPQRAAVINTFFNGKKVLDSIVYRNERLRDRPLINTSWDVVLNRRDEFVNQDVELNSLSDIRLYLYYTDFTEI